MSDTETNGNVIGERRGVGSTEDLSEYTDADESISAPTEILAEFLSAIMLKDYETALKYCKLILHYEPNNSTAREFYPLIIEKIQIMRAEEEDDEDSSSDISSAGSSNSLPLTEESESKAGDSDATSASYSSLEDDEADKDNNATTALTSKDIANANSIPTNKIAKKTSVHNKRSEDVKRKLDTIIGSKKTLPVEKPKSGALQAKKAAQAPASPLRRNLHLRKGNINARSNHLSAGGVRSTPGSPRRGFTQPDNGNYPVFSSDSESPTDPTVHELKTKSTSVKK